MPVQVNPVRGSYLYGSNSFSDFPRENRLANAVRLRMVHAKYILLYKMYYTHAAGREYCDFQVYRVYFPFLFFFFHYGSCYCASVGNNTLQCSFKPLCRKTTVFESRQLSSWPRAICFSVWTTEYNTHVHLLINWQYDPLRHRTRRADN